MGDSSQNFGPVEGGEAKDIVIGTKENLGSSRPKFMPNNVVNRIALFNRNKGMGGAVGCAALFLLKVAALESIRRFSKAKCPFAWHGLQALQVLCYPPFKWIQRWSPFKRLVKGMEVLSTPLLVIAVATSLSSQTQCSSANEGSDSPSRSDGNSEQTSVQTTLDTRSLDETPQGTSSENWLIRLYKELENQGIMLPERFTEDELGRFYRAANGDFACLLSSVKKTSRWRDTYRILSDFELEEWSHMVFWHGFDVKRRPCLVVRLGLACTTLPSHDTPRFAQAVVSQVDHGVLHLVDEESPQIAVLVDCEGLSSPLRFPMQMMRSCSSLLQDHFPNRLGCLVVIRLPPVVRVLAQTFIQILKPVTREKLKIEEDKFLFEYLQSLPSYLDGECSCTKCSKLEARARVMPVNEMELLGDGSEGGDLSFPRHNNSNDIDSNVNRSLEQLLRTAIISILMLWVFVAIIAGLYDPETGNFLSS